MGGHTLKFNRKIEEGFLDLFYTYKLKEKKDYKKINKILSKLHLVISDSENKALFIKKDYDQYLSYCRSKLNGKIEDLNKADIYENLKEMDIDTEVEQIEFKAYYEDDAIFSRSYKCDILEEEISVDVEVLTPNKSNIIKANVIFHTNEELFIKQKINELNNILNENSKYTGTDLEYLLKPYMLQPIKLVNIDETNNSKNFINVYLWVYTSGCITIQYTIPINDSNFENWIKTEEKKYHINTKIPLYINDKKNDKEFIYSENIYDYKEAINAYNKFLFENLKLKNFENNIAQLELFTLGKYDKMPKTFQKSVHDDIKRDFYWIVNPPFGYINETPENKYIESFEKRYDINKYSSMFTSTNYKILIAWNDSIKDIDKRYNEFIINKKYYISICYIIIPIHQLLMKKVYYSSTLNKPYSDLLSKKDIINKQKNLTYIKDYMFYISGHAYGSLVDALNYLEDTMTNFLQSKAINKKMEVYKEIVDLREREEKENSNLLNSFLAVLVTVIFGVDAIDKITKLINTEFGINLTGYNFNIWIILLFLLLIIFIYPKLKHYIKLIKNIISSKTKIFRNIYYEVKYRLKK